AHPSNGPSRQKRTPSLFAGAMQIFEPLGKRSAIVGFQLVPSLALGLRRSPSASEVFVRARAPARKPGPPPPTVFHSSSQSRISRRQGRECVFAPRSSTYVREHSSPFSRPPRVGRRLAPPQT